MKFKFIELLTQLKIDKVRAFQRKSFKFCQRKSLKYKHKSLKRFWATIITLGIKLNNFWSIWLWNDLFGLKCHIPLFQSPVWGGGSSLFRTLYWIFPFFNHDASPYPMFISTKDNFIDVHFGKYGCGFVLAPWHWYQTISVKILIFLLTFF